MGSITSLREAWNALWRRAWIIILVLAVGLPASVWFALSQERVYEATAVIQIEGPKIAGGVPGADPRASWQASDAQLNLIEQETMARGNLVAIIDRFDLFPELESQARKVALLREAVEIEKLNAAGTTWGAETTPTGLSIRVRLGRAQQAADVANRIVDGILAEARRRSDSRAEQTLAFFTGEQERIRAEIEVTESAFAQFKRENAGALPEAIPAQRARLNELLERRTAIDQQLLELQSDGGRLLAEEAERRAALLEQKRAVLDQPIAQLKSLIARAPEVERQINAFQRDLESLQQEFRAVTERRTEAEMTRLLEIRDQAERFEVLERALAPDSPISASRRKVAMMGGVVSLVVALGAALALEMMDGTIRTAAQLEAQLGVRPVIVVPRLKRPSRRGRRLRRLAIWLALPAVASAAALAWVFHRAMRILSAVHRRSGTIPTSRAAGQL